MILCIAVVAGLNECLPFVGLCASLELKAGVLFAQSNRV